MNPNERRRIAWGPDTDSRLDPFVIDRQGRVFNAEKDELKTAMVQVHAARIWNKTGRELWHSVDPTAKNGQGLRRPHLKAVELIRTRPDGTEVTQWLYRRKGASLPKTVTPRPGELPLVGDPSDDWFGIGLPGRYASVFHGPSMAAWLFGVTQLDPGPFGAVEPPRDGDASSTT